jgi:hypothetical protein
LAGHHACAAAGLSWDISADGRRFLPLKPAETSTPDNQLNVVIDWFEELKRLVPTN